jgi:hypothetical protein
LSPIVGLGGGREDDAERLVALTDGIGHDVDDERRHGRAGGEDDLARRGDEVAPGERAPGHGGEVTVTSTKAMVLRLRVSVTAIGPAPASVTDVSAMVIFAVAGARNLGQRVVSWVPSGR